MATEKNQKIQDKHKLRKEKRREEKKGMKRGKDSR